MLTIDLFAGGGGASEGITQATGHPVFLAINHDPHAVQMHALNHPVTHHRCESIYTVDPRQAIGARAADLLWASPSCTHFSRARGGTPVSRQERGLGWMILRWAAQARPRCILAENVAEWQTWGPVRRGRPVRARSGAYFQQLVSQLRDLGYAVEWRILCAADFGAPTTRRRLFLIACRDAAPVWPDPTHGPFRQPYRTAAECIDWSDLGASIFTRARPLADATCRRIAAGIVRYVLTGTPYLAPVSASDPGAQAPQIAAFLAKHYSGVIGSPMDRPLGTVTAVDHHSLIAAHMTTIDQQSNRAGHASAADPVSTITHKARHALVAAFLTTYYSGGGTHHAVSDPLPAIVTKARHGLVTVEISGTTYALTDIRLRMLTPRELARAQGFPDTYHLIGTQAQQIARIGNSVCPPIARALVAANLPPLQEARA